MTSGFILDVPPATLLSGGYDHVGVTPAGTEALRVRVPALLYRMAVIARLDGINVTAVEFDVWNPLLLRTIEPTGNTADNVDDHVGKLNWYTIEVADIEVEPELYVMFPGGVTVHNTVPDTPVDAKFSLNERRILSPLLVVVGVGI